MNMITNVIVTH